VTNIAILELELRNFNRTTLS